MFVEKTPEQIADMTAKEYATYLEEKRAHEVSELEKSLDAKLKAATENGATKEQIESLEGANKALIAEIEKQGLLLKKLSEGGSTEKKNTLVDELKANKDAIIGLAKGISSTEVVIKADTVRASISDNTQSVMLPDVGQLATRRLSMYDLFPKVTVSTGNHNGTISYYDWDEATIVRAAEMVAEGDKFPESTAKFKGYTLTLRKVGDTLPVSAEFYEDAVMFAAELVQFLNTNVALKVDDQLCNGNNTGEQLKGLLESVPAFNAALVSKVEDATFYDLLAVATEQITNTGGAKYMPNFVVMRKSLINKMRLTKDKNENYVIPPFVSRDGREVDGMTVIESNIVPANTLVLGDRNYGRIYEMGGVTFDRGYIGDQFAEDMETLKVRKRLAFLIREADKTGFVKITDVDAAITAITAS